MENKRILPEWMSLTAPGPYIKERLPQTWRNVLWRWKQIWKAEAPPIGWVWMGDLRRVQPVSSMFGYERGLPIDRYYIEGFLARQQHDICGRVLEIGDNAYTMRYGGSRVTKSEVLHVVEGNPQATLIGDITHLPQVADNLFDCIVLTQTLHLIYDYRAALQTAWRILKPGGVLLVTVPGISQIDRNEWGHTWYWSFTARAALRMFAEEFGEAHVQVQAHGNVLSAVAFLEGLAVAELKQHELDYRDPAYEVVITVRAVKGDRRA